MKKRILAVIFLMASAVYAVWAQTGTWSGKLDIQGTKLSIVFHLEDDNPTMDSPDQGAKGIPISVERSGVGKVDISIPALGARYEGVCLLKQIVGTFQQMNVSLPLTLVPGEDKPKRPQTPSGPFPYTAEEVSFANGDVVLNGTLVLPEGYSRETPALIMVTGSGQQNRDEEIFDHKPFAVIADAFARAGIATLRYDDRGLGTGAGSFYDCTTEDFKEDALAGMKLLRERFNKVGVIGHSEGGTIALMLAAENQADFIISLAGMSVSGAETLLWQNKVSLSAAGIPEETVTTYCRVLDKAFNTRISGGQMPKIDEYDLPDALKQNYLAALAQLQMPYMKHFLSLDIRPLMGRICCPVMALNGSKDTQVEASSNLEALRNGLAADSKNVIESIDGVNHLFQHCTTGVVTEYRDIEETFAPEVLKKMSGWIQTVCSDDRAEGLTLHYDRPAEYFDEALPLGNGRLGAMVYGGTSTDRLSLNDITLWSGEPDRGEGHHDFTHAKHITPWGEAASWTKKIRESLESEDYAKVDSLQKKVQGHYSESYQPLGTLWINYPEGDRITEYSRQLDISDATATVSYLRNGKQFKTEYLVSSPDSVIVIHLSGEAPINASIRLDSQQPHAIKAEDGLLICDGYTAYHTYPGYYDTEKHMLYDPDRGIHFRTVVSCKDGIIDKDGHLRISGVDETTIIVSNATSFNGFDKDPVTEGREYKESARQNASEAATKGWDALKSRHERDYRRYFDRVAIDLGETPDEIKRLPTDIQLLRYADGEANPELEVLYFQYGRYLLISSSRTPGIPANLQGLWNESIDPPWSCNYTTNINLEENYWAAEASGLAEMHASLLGFLHNLSATGEVSAKNYYGIDRGWCLGHNSDVWAMTSPVGLGTGDPKWANWTFGGAWLSTHIWEHWLFSRNIDDLRRDYPVLKGAAMFCMDYLVEKDGELIPSPSTSPENDYITDSGYSGSTLYGSTCDISIIRECIADALSAAEILEDKEFAEEAAQILPRLRGFKVGENGALQEWYHDWRDKDPYHRHQSHLFGVYPGHQIGPEGPLAEAALKSLEIKGFETTGWSCGWRVNLYARLGDAENSYRMFRRLLRYVSPDGYQGTDARRGGGTYPNLLDAHSPFQIDGNFGGCAGVIEMLVQSDAEDVRLLPALPSAWPEGSIKGIRTRTGKIVDMSWKNGKIVDYRIR